MFHILKFFHFYQFPPPSKFLVFEAFPKCQFQVLISKDVKFTKCWFQEFIHENVVFRIFQNVGFKFFMFFKFFKFSCFSRFLMFFTFSKILVPVFPKCWFHVLISKDVKTTKCWFQWFFKFFMFFTFFMVFQNVYFKC